MVYIGSLFVITSYMPREKGTLNVYNSILDFISYCSHMCLDKDNIGASASPNVLSPFVNEYKQ